MKLSFRAYNLPFKHPFTISKGTKTHQPSIVVALEHFGVTGYGEAPAIPYYDVTVEKMLAVLEAKKPMIEKFAFTDSERYWHYLHHLLPAHPFVVCALDMAGWDLFGKLHGQQLHQLWKLDLANNPITDLTIGIDTIEKMVAKMLETPWPIYKIKLGTKKDIEIITELRKHSDSIFRIDANAAWTANDALEKINAFVNLGVEFIEQPLAKEDWEGMKFLYEHSPLPLFADESCVSEHDVEKCKDHFHGINIKLTKCSGITPARRMITHARQLGMKVMIGCMNESSIGTAAVAQLLPLLDHVDMDGPLLLAEDIAEGVTFDYGKVCYTNAPGLGLKSVQF